MDERDPVARLTAFFEAMHGWEVWRAQAWSSDRDPGVDERARAELDAIYLEHCTPKPRLHGRQASLSFSNPPGYDVATQPVVSVERTGRRAVVRTDKTDGLRSKYRYTLVLSANGWRVDRREFYDSFEEKWARSSL